MNVEKGIEYRITSKPNKFLIDRAQEKSCLIFSESVSVRKLLRLLNIFSALMSFFQKRVVSLRLESAVLSTEDKTVYFIDNRQWLEDWQSNAVLEERGREFFLHGNDINSRVLQRSIFIAMNHPDIFLSLRHALSMHTLDAKAWAYFPIIESLYKLNPKKVHASKTDKRILQITKNVLTEEDQKYLSNRISTGLSLMQQIIYLCDQMRVSCGGYLGDVNKFAKEARNVRNGLFHATDKKNDEILLDVIVKLDVLLNAIVLDMIGINKKKIGDIISRTGAYQNYLALSPN